MRHLLFLMGILLLTSCSPKLAPVNTPTMKITPVQPSPEPLVPALSASPTQKTAQIDLSGFVSAWNSGDIATIRSLYTEDALYYSEADMVKLSRDELVDVRVSSPEFEQYAANFLGMSFRINGKPISVYDRLVAFSYRWENSEAGYNGVALLRYEGNKIFLHSFMLSGQLTPNPGENGQNLSEINLDQLMQVWKDGEIKNANMVYSKNPVILSDEDLAQASWRDFSTAPGLDQLLVQFAGWSPTIDGEPSGVEDMAIFAWHWNVGNFPVGYGVRMVKFINSSIVMDIRYAIRPWEASGKTFMNP